jgi:hypothetical protein
MWRLNRRDPGVCPSGHLRPVPGPNTPRDKVASRVGVIGAGVTLLLAIALVSAVALGAIRSSTASARVVQRQPAPRTCHARGNGIFQLPDGRCTPGLRNPAVTQRTIRRTICLSGWTSRVRPPASITNVEKRASMRAYGDTAAASKYEYDHDLPLELGGAVNAAGNLWPEPDYARRAGFYLNPKDRLENLLKGRVCSGKMSLATAQSLIVTNWVSAYNRYVGPSSSGSGGSGSGSTSAGGYYASSYPTAHYIYCADDPAWKSLSPAYLVHFSTLAQALARFPGRTLHQPC